MRPASLVAIVVSAACLGGVLALGVSRGAGWLDEETRTVVLAPGTDTAPAAVDTVAVTPVARAAFDPARIYASRVAGVVTIYSFFGASTSPGAREAQGSGFVVSRDGV